MEIHLFDGHCDTLLHCWRTGDSMRKSRGDLDLSRGSTYSGYCQLFAIFAMDDMVAGKSSYDIYEEQYALFCRQMEESSNMVSHCRSAEDAKRAHREGKIAAFLSVEGAHILNCDLEKLREAHSRGVRAVNLTWNNANLLSGSNCEEPERGLSGQGREFVSEMQRLGMLVDVSHLSDSGFWDVMEIAHKPVIASHSNSRTVCFHPRNLTDEQFTAIINNQGIVGLNLCREFVGGSEDLESLLRHLEHFLALGGEKTVALGSDFDGCTPVKGIEDVSQWRNLYERLLRLNYPESTVRDLFFNNLMRVVSE